MEDDNLKLGRCCACEGEDETVRNIIMLDRRSPEPGIGCWGCLQCGLPTAGAVAVVCDHCLETKAEILFACLGAPADNRRIPIGELPPEPFDHDMSKHPEEEYAAGRGRRRLIPKRQRSGKLPGQQG
jgi:hypothetical protein